MAMGPSFSTSLLLILTGFLPSASMTWIWFGPSRPDVKQIRFPSCEKLPSAS